MGTKLHNISLAICVLCSQGRAGTAQALKEILVSCANDAKQAVLLDIGSMIIFVTVTQITLTLHLFSGPC